VPDPERKVTHREQGLPVRRLLRRATLVVAGILGVGLAIVTVMVQTERLSRRPPPLETKGESVLLFP
jgi:hypothetical protein